MVSCVGVEVILGVAPWRRWGVLARGGPAVLHCWRVPGGLPWCPPVVGWLKG